MLQFVFMIPRITKGLTYWYFGSKKQDENSFKVYNACDCLKIKVEVRVGCYLLIQLFMFALTDTILFAYYNNLCKGE